MPYGSRTRDIGCTCNRAIAGCVIQWKCLNPSTGLIHCQGMPYDRGTKDTRCSATRQWLAVLFSGDVLILALGSFIVKECHDSGTKDTRCSATRQWLAVLFSGDVLMLALNSLSGNAMTVEQKTHGAVQPGSGWLCYSVEMF